MNLDETLALYDAEVRAKPVARPGLVVERTGGVVRLTGLFNFISSWDQRADVAGMVAAQAAYFRARGEALMWRVHDHDGPAGLAACLAANGFQPDGAGTLMFFDTNQVLQGAAGKIEVRRVGNTEDLDDFVHASDAAFDDDEASRRRAAYAQSLDDPDMALFVARSGGEAIASARLEMAPGRPFGLMFGGGTAPAHRGLGAYRALVAARVEEARRRGLDYLSTEARETSRPILERLGFVVAGRETTWVLPAAP
jgi:ribosomal protein S18 acetylase RimI-like enzyme